MLNNAEKIIKEQEEKELLAIHKGKDSSEENYDSNEESESSSSETEKDVKDIKNIKNYSYPHKKFRYNNRNYRKREKYKKIELIKKKELNNDSNSESTEKIIPNDDYVENEMKIVNQDFINKKRDRNKKKY